MVCFFSWTAWGAPAPAKAKGKLIISDSQEIRSLQAETFKFLQQMKFGELEANARKFRRENKRFRDGSWMLAAFYKGLTTPTERLDESDGVRFMSLPDSAMVVSLLEKWALADPESATARIALGHAYIDMAWALRGDEAAVKVSAERWKPFEERLGLARRILFEAESLKSDDPSLYHALLRLGLAQGWKRPEFEVVYEKGAALAPQYDLIHLAKAIYLLPQWMGQGGDWQRFAHEVAQKRGDKDGAILYTRIAWGVALYLGGGERIFKEQNIPWSAMKKGFKCLMDEYPGSNLNMNWFCRFACLAGDAGEARLQMMKIGNRMELEVWGSFESFERWREWVSNRDDQR